ncbi:MAG: hypothetical protein IT280_11320 [Ignavibacteria bacterium]|nr:hypothetical protein [Ignavibacteria bacterium]
MNNNLKNSGFYKFVAYTSLLVIVLASYPVYKYFNTVQINSIICGYFISLLNAFIGFKLNTIALSRSTKSFMVLVFGGMGIRLLIVMLLLVILIYLTNLDSLSLTGSVFFFYTLFITIEIYFLHKKQMQNTNQKIESAAAEN